MKKPEGWTDADEVASAPGTAEAKRRAARRRFLRLGGVAGPAFVILTVYHERSFGGQTFRLTANKGKIWVSSAMTCTSLGGTVTDKMKEVTDSLTGARVMRVGCDRG
jgi:hypothetical protein